VQEVVQALFLFKAIKEYCNKIVILL